MRKWHVEIEQNGGEYAGWVTFFADEVISGGSQNTLLVDGREMAFDEKVVSFSSTTLRSE